VAEWREFIKIIRAFQEVLQLLDWQWQQPASWMHLQLLPRGQDRDSEYRPHTDP